jgi:hypothetical protein
VDAIQNVTCVHSTPATYNRIQSLENISYESRQEILYLIDVGRPGGDYVAHIMLNNGAAILLKQTSQFSARPVRYLPVMAFAIAKTMERGELDRFTIETAHWCWIPGAEHPKPELWSSTLLLLLPAKQCAHGGALREAKDSVQAPHLRDGVF